MKNIHVLPTDKLSRLRYNLSNVLVFTKEFCRDYGKQVNQNIYITSDEEIKDKCYVLCSASIGALYLDGVINTASMLAEGEWKKIILTDNEDLIKDGVQAIDDEFLEWFVKNPSCEEVEVIRGLFNSKGEKVNIIDSWKYYSTCFWYKIIIPKEEPKKIFDLPIATNLGNALTETMKSVSQHEGGIKQGEINLPNFKEEVIKTEEDAKIFVETMENIQEPNDKLKKAFKDFNKQEKSKQGTLNHFLSTSNVIVKDSQKFDYKNTVLPKEFRQETFEKNIIEEAKKIWDELHPNPIEMALFGAKWQQEQNKNLYSEEQVELIAKEMVNWAIDNIGSQNPQSGKKFDEVLNKFKKK